MSVFFGVFLTVAYFVGCYELAMYCSPNREEDDEFLDDGETEDYIDAENERQYWRIKAKEDELSEQLRRVRKTKRNWEKK